MTNETVAAPASAALGSGAGSVSGKEFAQASNLDGGVGYDHYASKIKMHHPSQAVWRPWATDANVVDVDNSSFTLSISSPAPAASDPPARGRVITIRFSQ